ncbi:MAG: phosphate-starvation-inducible protein PsiE [Zoogloeaceae bacterium]|jgi:protein PsiE|nr:phosphate-starvation-inducible protein PsiE [Zoogloeaceae bacterium]
MDVTHDGVTLRSGPRKWKRKNMPKISQITQPQLLAKTMKKLLSFMLLTLAIILLLFLLKETWILITILLKIHPGHDGYEMIEAIIIWFLYFEFIALIAKYFESKFHFPLRYFIYIGITAIIRLIIVDHDKHMATLIYALAILVLLGALYIANTSLLKRL